MKIKRFKISGLYGYKNIDIDFSTPYKILVGDNGLGKTTILNILYFSLSKNFDRLSQIEFESIEIYFPSQKKIIIQKELMIKFLNKKEESENSHFSQIFANRSKNELDDLRKIIESHVNSPAEEQKRRLLVSESLKKMGFNINATTHFIFQTIKKYFDEIDSDRFYDTINDIDNYVDCKILYFPTFRRIEEDYKNIKKITDVKDVLKKNQKYYGGEIIEDRQGVAKNFIQFGMEDVKEQISSITNQIMQSSVIGFSDITADMLHQLLTDFPSLKTSKSLIANKHKIDIILDRLSSNISDEDRLKIRKAIESGSTSNKGLIYFINKLTELYQNQETQDIAIKNFTEVCNSYFTNKKFIYNEREISIKIESNFEIEYNNNAEQLQIKTREVKLEQLSSGEKQIVSLFSKIHLETLDKFIILFDEPELSLSVFWQMKLLPDILKSNRCDFMLAVTHSPFIYENELEDMAVDLNDYIR